MPRVSSIALTSILALVAASPATRAEVPARPERTRTPTLGSGMLEVIRAFGAPSQVRTVNLVPVAGGPPTQAVSWIYKRPNAATLEFLIGDEGKVLQVTTRSKALDPFRIEPQP
jgi:hypothetical protein